MKKEEVNDKALHEIFQRMDATFASEDLHAKIMQKVYRAQKKKEIRNLIIVSLASVALVAFATYILTYYMSFNLLKTFASVIKEVANAPFTGISPFAFMIFPFLLLLWIDHRLRKRFRQNGSGQ